MMMMMMMIIIIIKNIAQTAVINIVFQRICFTELDASYTFLHTFSKVTVTIVLKLYIVNNNTNNSNFINKFLNKLKFTIYDLFLLHNN